MNFKQTPSEIYICRRCWEKIYNAKNKYNTQQGYLHFNAEVAGAVKNLSSAYRASDEIQCVHCDARLGCVFTNGDFASKNIRFYNNFLSLKFVRK